MLNISLKKKKNNNNNTEHLTIKTTLFLNTIKNAKWHHFETGHVIVKQLNYARQRQFFEELVHKQMMKFKKAILHI